MHLYDVYGGRLHSEGAFPELYPVQSDGKEPDWTIHRADRLVPSGELLGAELLSSSSEARLYRVPDGYRLDIDRIGQFGVSGDGAQLTYSSVADAPPDFIRSHLLGRALGIALDLQGILSLHGSAVATRVGAIGFLAPKYSGKSTIAAALLKRGCRLVSDDTLAVRPGDEPQILSGVPALRLTAETVAMLSLDEAGPLTRDGKFVVRDFGPDRLVDGPTRLSALYILQPVEADRGAAPVFRELLSGPQAALALTGHSRIGALLGASHASRLLRTIATVTRFTDVYALGVARDPERLEEVADQLYRWHSP